MTASMGALRTALERLAESTGRIVLLTTGLDRPELVPRVGRSILAGAAVLGAGIGVAPGLGAAALAWWLPALLDGRRRAARAARADRAVPELAELLLVALGGGASAHRALSLVAPWAPPPVAPEVSRAAAMVAAGRSLSDALARLGRCSPAMAVLAAEIDAAVRTGAPLAAVVARLADDGRRRDRQQAEAAARRLPVLLLFPLTCCILPAFGLLTVGPALAAGLRTLQP